MVFTYLITLLTIGHFGEEYHFEKLFSDIKGSLKVIEFSFMQHPNFSKKKTS